MKVYCYICLMAVASLLFVGCSGKGSVSQEAEQEKLTYLIDTYANQTDLAATLLNQMGLPTDEFSFSKDILNPCVPHYAFYTFNNGFGFIDESGVSVYDNEGNKILLEEPESGNETRLEKGKVLLQTLYDDLGKR